MQYRTDDAPVHPGMWGFFGGGIDEGETPEEGLKREAFEEIEYKIDRAHLLVKMEFKSATRIGYEYVYLVKYDHKQKLVLHEGKDLGWFDVSEISQLDTSPHVMKTLDKFGEEIEKFM